MLFTTYQQNKVVKLNAKVDKTIASHTDINLIKTLTSHGTSGLNTQQPPAGGHSENQLMRHRLSDSNNGVTISNLK